VASRHAFSRSVERVFLTYWSPIATPVLIAPAPSASRSGAGVGEPEPVLIADLRGGGIAKSAPFVGVNSSHSPPPYCYASTVDLARQARTAAGTRIGRVSTA